MSEFTKGEWLIVDSTGQSLSVWASESECITTINYNFHDKEYQNELKANAHLIASAPDMYAMIKEVADMQKQWYGYGVDTHMKLADMAKKMETLLKKARGES